MPHPEQLCEECSLEMAFKGVNPLENAKLTVRLILRGVLDGHEFTKPDQAKAVERCLEQQTQQNRCPAIQIALNTK